MAKNIYIGVSGIARKVKTPNIGVSGVARSAKAGYIGVSGVARQFYQPLEVGHYWLIEPNSIKEYNASGTLLSTTNGTVSSWTCPASGAYYVELHGKGGSGGDSYYEPYDYYTGYYTLAGGGGGGGGSGGYTEINNLPAGTYTISWSSGASITGNGLSSGYYVKNGYAGGPAFRNGNNAEVYGGSGGSYGNCGSEVTNMAKDGGEGRSTVELREEYVSASGGIKGSGGATIGSYGNGGSGDYIQSSSSYRGSDPQGAAIIIKKQ